MQNRENRQSKFPRFAQPPVSGKKIFLGKCQMEDRGWTRLRKIAALVKFFAPTAPWRASRIHFRTRLSDTPPTPTYIKNGLHCLLFHRLRRGPQGDQDPGVYFTRERRNSPLTTFECGPKFRGDARFRGLGSDAGNTRLTTMMPSFLLFSGQVCFQGHQGRHLPRVRHLPRRRRVPHHPLRLREERRA